MSGTYRDGADEQSHAYRQHVAEEMADCPLPPTSEPERQSMRTHDEHGELIVPW